MRITKVSIPKAETESIGLEVIDMSRLGQVVLIAGQNGAGKTRLINKIKSISEKMNEASKEGLEIDLMKLQQSAPTLTNNLFKVCGYKGSVKEELKLTEGWLENQDEIRDVIKVISAMDTHDPQDVKKNTALKDAKGCLDQLLLRKEKLQVYDFIETTHRNPKVIEFFPKDTKLGNYSSRTIKQNDDAYNNIVNKQSNSNISGDCLSVIKKVCDDYFVKTHHESNINDKERELFKGDYNRLLDLVEKLLGETIQNRSSNPEIFGQPIEQANLSDGQKILLQLAVLLFANDASIDKSIILIDEPENHLHPKVIIEVLDRIVEVIPNGQIWIATHSINILSHFDSENIWYMEKGRIAYAGKTPELVLRGLLGEEEERDKLKDFLMLPQNLGLQRFTYECLFPPAAVDTPKTDKQLEQIQRVISERIRQNEKIKILDYGVGKGRLLNSFIESPYKDSVDYLAYDEFDIDKSSCEAKLVSLYGSSEKRYFNSLTELSSACDTGTVDFVIMCNVLHEISPDKWIEEFTGIHSFMHLLKDGGNLVIIEDQLLAFGENAHNYGYLVLDECQLKILFNIPANKYVVDDYDGSGRLKAHIIAKEDLSKITDKTKREAVESLKATSKEKIEKIEKENKNYKTGRLYSFWLMQYFNTLKALKEF